MDSCGAFFSPHSSASRGLDYSLNGSFEVDDTSGESKVFVVSVETVPKDNITVFVHLCFDKFTYMY